MQKKIIIPVFIIVMVFVFNGCKDRASRENLIIVKGTVENNEEGNWLKFQELGIKEIRDIDSTRLDRDGHFRFITYAEHPNLYVLKLNDQHATIAGSPGDTLNFRAKADELLLSYSVEGNRSAEILEKYFEYTNRQRIKLDSLAKVFRSSKGKENFYEKRQEIDSVYKVLVRQQKGFAEQIIRSNPGTLAALFILNQRLYSYKLFREDEDTDIFLLVDSALQQTQPQSKHAKDHHERAQKIKAEQKEEKLAEERLKKGAIAPEFALPNPEGDTISLNDFRGHHTLLSFWAAWNAMSRRNNPMIVELYKKYQDKGFRVLGVSLDHNRKMWEGAIEVDKMNFTNVSDLNYLESPIARLYNIDELPRYFLLDKEGHIIAKDLRIEELETKLHSIYRHP